MLRSRARENKAKKKNDIMKSDSNTEKKKRGKEAKRYKKQELEND